MSATASKPLVEPFFDPVTSTFTYVVYDRPAGKAAIIDPVLDFDPKAGRTTTAVADKVSAFVTQQQLGVDWILETHVHADHVSAAQVLKQRHGGRIAVGAAVCIGLSIAVAALSYRFFELPLLRYRDARVPPHRER